MRISLRLPLSLALLPLLSSLSIHVAAQTLGEQYEHYLQTASPPNVFGDVKCLRLGFQRDVGTAELLPGQAGPNLFAFCTGFPFVESGPGTSSAAVGGGGTGAAAGRSGRNDAALRRRRDNARAEDNESASNAAIRGGAAGSDIETLFANGSAFMSFDYRDEEQDVTHYEDGREAERKTFTLGADYRLDSTLLVGAALSFDELHGTFDSGGGFETRTYSAALYGSWLPVDALFVDFSAGYDAKDIDTTRIVGRQVFFVPLGQTEPRIRLSPPYQPVYGETNGQALAIDASAGYDFYLTRFTIGPRIGATFINTTTEAYTETGNSPMSLAFDEQKERSLLSSVGLQATVAFTVGEVVILPQLNAAWLHEYRNDQRTITARFAEDLRANPVRFGFLNQPPDRDVYTGRLSAVAVFRRGVSAFVAAEKLFAHDYRQQYGASLGVRWEL